MTTRPPAAIATCDPRTPIVRFLRLGFPSAIALIGATLLGAAPARGAARDPGVSAKVAEGPGASAPARAVPLVVAFPFENRSEDRSLYWIGEAVADGLAREIRVVGGPVVEREDRVALREEMDIPALSSLTLASQIRIAERLGATDLISGAYEGSGASLVVRARVVNVTTGRTGAWVPTKGSAREIVALQKAIHRGVSPLLPSSARARSGEGVEAEDGVPQAAYERLLKSFLEDAPEKREQLLRRSLELAPDYLRAKIELAELYREGNQLAKASAVLTNQATRDRSLAVVGENLLAELEIEQGRPAVAEAALRRSLALRENARAHLLLARLAVARGDRATAVAELARSRKIDPEDPDLVEVESSLPAVSQP